VQSPFSRLAQARMGLHTMRSLAIAVCAVLALVLVACGGSDSDESAGGAVTTETAAADAPGGTEELLAKAAEDTEKARNAEASFEPWNPGPAPKPTAGLKAAAMSCLQAVPTCKEGGDAMGEAMKAIGWHGEVVDGGPDPSMQRTLVEGFMTKGIKAFGMMAIDPNGMADVLKRVNAKDIKWGIMAGVDPQPFGGMGPSVDIAGGFYEGGQTLAAWVANDSKGKAKILVFNASDNPALQDREKGFRDYLKPFPDIEYVQDTVNVPFVDVGAPLQSQAQSVFQKYPAGKVDYVFAPFDGYASFLVNAAQAQGRDDLKILGFDGAAQAVDFIREGRSQAATLATAWGWCSWALIDDLNRALHGEEVKGGTCPSQIIDKNNLPPQGKSFDGNADYQSAYRKLWGTEG
jgi:ABC-type sugar transport system substrate-binding protein